MDKKKISGNRLLNFFKGLACIGVVFIHVMFPGNFGVAMETLARFAVPLFLMISGYYLYNNDNSIVKNKLPKKISHIARLTLISVLTYLLYAIFIHAFFDTNIPLGEWIKSLLSVKYLVKVLILNDLTRIEAGHLWFLLALLWCYIIFVIINKRNMYIISYILAPVLLICKAVLVGMTGNSEYVANFIFTGFPYVVIGFFIAANKEKIYIKNLYNVIIILTFASFSVICEIISLNSIIKEMMIILYSIFVFIFAVRNPDIVLSNVIEYIGEKYSLYIYIIHFMIWGLLYRLEYQLLAFSIINWINPVIVLFISIICSYLFLQCKNSLVKLNKNNCLNNIQIK